MKENTQHSCESYKFQNRSKLFAWLLFQYSNSTWCGVSNQIELDWIGLWVCGVYISYLGILISKIIIIAVAVHKFVFSFLSCMSRLKLYYVCPLTLCECLCVRAFMFYQRLRWPHSEKKIKLNFILK